MMVIFVSQCEKNALAKTRRVLDAFADRIGDNTWQTVITNEGLQAVKKLLRKTASKSTAVSCHWIRTRSRSDLLWIVGNKRKFNERGVVAVNYTEGDIEQFMDKEKWQSLEVIKLLAAIAGFFHDIGKANVLFQNKLDPNISAKLFEPYRHEWVSFRLFQSFVQGKSDRDWLKKLSLIDNKTEQWVLKNLGELKDGIASNVKKSEPVLPPIAKCVAWLILSHHKLPVYPKDGTNPPNITESIAWFEENLEACWNSPQCLAEDWSKADIEKNWMFPHGTPLKSGLWQARIRSYAKELLNYEKAFEINWFEQHFTLHLARLSLMLSDHYYSSGVKINEQEQDVNYLAYANTYKDEFGKRQYKQKLDEHNIQVGKNAYKFTRVLPRLIGELPSITDKKAITQNVPEKYKASFGWQDKAYKLAKSLREEVKQQGFFGICMASTGKGKTRGNLRIMAGVTENVRLSIALGLRTLTLQTGDALKEDMKLSDDELAVLIGSTEVKELHEKSKQTENQELEQGGSLSAESLLEEQLILHENLPAYFGVAQKWLEHDSKITKLIQAPVLVSTIDYLTPATEGVKSGRQIAPMLRLLSSDLILDEPDDFGLEDLPALCRLVNWSGMLGGRVLLSTATLSHSLAKNLFEAYLEGRRHYVQVNSLAKSSEICCAWFDEFDCEKLLNTANTKEFETAHKKFVTKRIKHLKKAQEEKCLHKGKIIPIEKIADKPPVQLYAQCIYQAINELHQQHFIEVNGKNVSFGLVRMANIDPLVAIGKSLFSQPSTGDIVIHYCVYHSQFPLLQRSYIENRLDRFLTRKNKEEWLKATGIESIVDKFAQKHHIFVVLATAVAEVGRDHDYDWAIVEPSSMRSIVQLAGRVQRHRKQEPKTENIYILSKNLKGLRGRVPSFEKPGYESPTLRYKSRDLQCLTKEQAIKEQVIKKISAIARIEEPKITANLITKKSDYTEISSFELLEGLSQELKLQGNAKNIGASAWWKYAVAWTAHLQQEQPFRKSRPQNNYRLTKTRRDEFVWQIKEKGHSIPKYANTNNIKSADQIALANGVNSWINFELDAELNKLNASTENDDWGTVHRYTQVSLDAAREGYIEEWFYQPLLGIYKELKNNRYENE